MAPIAATTGPTMVGVIAPNSQNAAIPFSGPLWPSFQPAARKSPIFHLHL